MTPKETGALHFLSLDDEALIAQCEVDHYRASGPGGQKRNKTSSAIRLRHRPTGLIVTASDDRSQRVNRTRATRRLREAIALHVRSEAESGQSLSPLLRAGITKDGRIRVGRRDPRYYNTVSEILDLLAADDLRISQTAARLGVSTAALADFFRRDPKLWQRVNEMRREAELKPLR